ncbi:transposase, partial [Salmonella enterica subsp. enterica serovar Thompson]|nr:transposase [Salmonella enterica subsp. enterica serovar Thompson]
MMSSWITIDSLASLPNIGCSRATLARRANREGWTFRQLQGKRGVSYEYEISSLPLTIQEEVRERQIQQLMEVGLQKPAKPVVRRRRDPDAISPLEAYRGSPQLMEERLNALTENQRQVADARVALVREVFLLEEKGNIGRLKAINYVVSKARSGELPPLLQAAAVTANAKRGSGRTISRDPLYQWVLKYSQAQNAAERLLLLAPGKREEMKVEEISWLADFLAEYRQSNGRPMTEAYEDFVKEWNRRYAEEPYMLQIIPSYDAIRRVMKKLPEVVKQKGRITGSEYRQLEGFTRRDWSKMPVNYVWIGDGHGMKMKCAHPIHGRPFSPEVTFVIDGGTRFVVGWSLDLA